MIEQAFIIAMLVQAWSSFFWEGMIFGKVSGWIEYKFPNWIYKPLIGCPICMTVWYGAALAFIFQFNWLAVPVAVGINVVITLWTNYSNDTDLNSTGRATVTGDSIRSTNAGSL